MSIREEALKIAVGNWLIDGDVGMSSKTIATWLAYKKLPRYYSHPHDPDDFDRCLRLLEEIPSLRSMLPDMAGVSKEWAAIIHHWDEIEASQLDEIGLGWTKKKEAPKTYRLMRNILDSAEKAPQHDSQGESGGL